jgi:DNA-binding Xre family transcriptional regulator
MVDPAAFYAQLDAQLDGMLHDTLLGMGMKEPDEIHRRVLTNVARLRGTLDDFALARRVGVTQNAMRMILSGRTVSITSHALLTIARALDVDPAELLRA